MVSDSYRSKYNFWAQVSKITTTRLLHLQICTPHCWLKPPVGKLSDSFSLVGNGHVLFPRTWCLSLGVNPSLTERLANTQFPMPGAYKPFPFLPLPQCPHYNSKESLAFWPKGNFIQIRFSSSLHYQKALSLTPPSSYYGASYCYLSSFRGKTLIILHHWFIYSKAHVQHVFIHIYFL